MPHPPVSTPPAADLIPVLQDLAQWRNAAVVGATVAVPPAINLALLELAVHAIVAHRLVPNPHLSGAITAVVEAVDANRVTARWVHGRRLFAGTVHA